MGIAATAPALGSRSDDNGLMQVFVTGGGRGFIAGHVVHALERAGHDVRHDWVDVRDRAALQRAVRDCEAVVHVAALYSYTASASEMEAINVGGTRNLLRAVRGTHIAVVYFSTDYVFDGAKGSPYVESDGTHPLSVYGRSKLLGERAVVLRTAWVYAAQGKNFLLTMLRLMRERGAVRVVADQYGTPTSAESIARALWAIAQRPKLHGILHWTDAGKASWYDFALAIAEEGHAAGLLSMEVKVTPITTADYPTAAHRPANSALDTRASIAQLGLAPPPWRDNLRATLAHIGAA